MSSRRGPADDLGTDVAVRYVADHANSGNRPGADSLPFNLAITE